MKIYDFDAKFYDYVRSWMALHPGLREDQVEEKYNEMMMSWLNAPAQWLGGEKPGMYFNRYEDPKDLLKLLEEYLRRDIGLPEPLYARIVTVGAECVPGLVRIVRDDDRPEALRATAMAILRDIGDGVPRELLIDLVRSAREYNELSEIAADMLSKGDPSVVEALMDSLETATDYSQSLILDICANYPASDRVVNQVIDRLRKRPESRAFSAALLGKLGDTKAVEPLKEAAQYVDLTYLDYIEIRNAIESLGGDPGEERVFNGDPDYEALRNM